MEKPSFNFRLLLWFPLAFVLTSCLELKVAVNFRTSTAGTVEIEALNYRLARGLSWEGLSFPAT